MSPLFADNTGDGLTDLVLMGTGYTYLSTDYPGIAIFSGSTLQWSMDVDDADVFVEFGEPSYWAGGMRSDLDITGDGVAEILFGQPLFLCQQVASPS